MLEFSNRANVAADIFHECFISFLCIWSVNSQTCTCNSFLILYPGTLMVIQCFRLISVSVPEQKDWTSNCSNQILNLLSSECLYVFFYLFSDHNIVSREAFSRLYFRSSNSMKSFNSGIRRIFIIYPCHFDSNIPESCPKVSIQMKIYIQIFQFITFSFITVTNI